MYLIKHSRKQQTYLGNIFVSIKVQSSNIFVIIYDVSLFKKFIIKILFFRGNSFFLFFLIFFICSEFCHTCVVFGSLNSGVNSQKTIWITGALKSMLISCKIIHYLLFFLL